MGSLLCGRAVLAVVVGAWCLLAGVAPAQAGPVVYLMRGLMDVSTGLDDLAQQLRRRGAKAVVASYTDKEELAAMAIREYKAGRGCPIAIVGHSLGADAAVDMSALLKEAGVPVALVVAFSPAFTRHVPGNVARVVNYYQSDSIWNHRYSGGAGFKGSVRNVDLAKDSSIRHFNIEKNPRLHGETLRMISGLSGTCGAPKV